MGKEKYNEAAIVGNNFSTNVFPNSSTAIVFDGYKPASDLVYTPEKPDRLHISVSFMEKPLVADGADVVFVYVNLKEIPGLIRLNASVISSKQSFTTDFQFHSVKE